MAHIIDIEGIPEVDLTGVPPLAATIITFLRRIELDTHCVWLDPALDVDGRLVRVHALLRAARASFVPDLACRAIEQVSLAHMGHDDSGRWERAVIEDAVVRDVQRGRVG